MEKIPFVLCTLLNIATDKMKRDKTEQVGRRYNVFNLWLFGSDLDQYATYPDWNFSRFTSVPLDKCWDLTLNYTSNVPLHALSN